ncbi:tripartite tricarboxylate transporter substrate binding protein [Roseococcus pinisoli]|uniref:Tripartite tricarboxylate transporter substrate binding protein n=1 Tax=Roseococcus pinisoli TaxID=2835040 RepID=A0ABS5Q8S0_9PROT|nr:tripartite tricarboxylate transporter substrate binding protein [Roseococcus pinisoli]MBS7809606.1 tripartite tricarboxylate transporter substrate binding protein [Roseococcus pinisoli]
MKRRTMMAAGLGTLAAPSLAGAQSAPSLRLIVPYAAGGPTDIQARILAEQMVAPLEQRVVVENRTGAGVMVGTEAVAKAAPDGSTALLTTVAHAVNPSLFPNLPYDTERDFAPVALIAKVPLVVLVRKDLPVADMRGFLDWLRARNGQAVYGSAGVGSAPHLGTALLLMMAGLQAVHVPYRGSAPAMTDLAAGRIDFYLDAAASGLAQVRAGNGRALAWSMRTRGAVAPDLPTVAESGVPGYEAYTWSGVFFPAATPPAAVQRLNAACRQAMGHAGLRARFAELGAELAEPAPPEALGEFLRAEIAKWREVVRQSGMSTQ